MGGGPGRQLRQSRAVEDVRADVEERLQRRVHRRKLRKHYEGRLLRCDTPRGRRVIGTSCRVADAAAAHAAGHVSQPLMSRQARCLRTAQTHSRRTLPALPPRRAARPGGALAGRSGMGRRLLIQLQHKNVFY